MKNEIFNFKQFSILQKEEVMKIGTDAVLLGAIAEVEDSNNILDIGTGTGILALILAQKSNANIFGIDINYHAVELAQYNAKHSNFKNKFIFHHTSLQNYYPEISFDLIISNPPYYFENNQIKEEHRKLARDENQLKIEDLAFHADRLLSSKGKIVVIYPMQQAEIFERAIKKLDYNIISKHFICPTINSAPSRLVICASKLKLDYYENTIIIELNKRHEYSEKYIDLTKEYYLMF